MKRRWSRTTLVVVLLSGWFALAAVVFTWFGLAAAQYRQEVQRYAAEFTGNIDQASSSLQNIATADTAAAAQTLRGLSATIAQKAAAAPQAPTMSGVTMGVDAEQAQLRRVTSAAETYARTLGALADCITYQQTIAQWLQSLSIKDATNAAQATTLADTWHEYVERMQSEPKPVQFTDAIATLTQKMAIVETHIRALADLHRQGNTAAFTAKQRELASAVAAFGNVATEISTISAALDAKAAADLAALKQSL